MRYILKKASFRYIEPITPLNTKLGAETISLLFIIKVILKYLIGTVHICNTLMVCIRRV
jgi:hypothetical protein